MKVLMYMYALAPYKIDFCNELGKVVDLTVLFEKELTKNRNSKWQKSINIENFKAYFLSRDNILKKIFNPSIIKFLKDETYDIIIFGGYTAINSIRAINYLSKREKIFGLEIDGGLINLKEKKIKYIIKKHFISKANYYLSPSKVSDDYLIYYGAENKNIFRYPFTSLRKKDLLKKPLLLEQKKIYRRELKMQEEKIVLSVGQFIYRKGFDVLLNNAYLLDNNIGIYLIGGKPTEELLKIKESQNLKNIHFIDFKQKKELRKYFLAADLFVFPTRYDIWGLVINEAMGYGLPIVTTDGCISGIELIENGKNGYIVEVENGEELINKINLLINNDSLKQKIGENNISKMKHYTIEMMAKTHYEIFKKISKYVEGK